MGKYEASRRALRAVLAAMMTTCENGSRQVRGTSSILNRGDRRRGRGNRTDVDCPCRVRRTTGTSRFLFHLISTPAITRIQGKSIIIYARSRCSPINLASDGEPRPSRWAHVRNVVPRYSTGSRFVNESRSVLIEQSHAPRTWWPERCYFTHGFWLHLGPGQGT